MKFNEWLMLTMEEKGMSQRALSRKTHMPQDSISNYCCGYRRPGLPNTVRMCRALDVDMNVLKEVEWIDYR